MRIPPPPLLIGIDISLTSRFRYPSITRSLTLARRILHPTEHQRLLSLTPDFAKFVDQLERSRGSTRSATGVSHEHIGDIYDDVNQIKDGASLAQYERMIQFLASRWTAKEAAKKAWGAHLVSWKDLRVESALTPESPRASIIPIMSGASGAVDRDQSIGSAPSIVLNVFDDESSVIRDKGSSTHSGRTGVVSVGERGEKVLEQVGRLSISHDGEYTVATVLVEEMHSEIRRRLQSRKVHI